MEQSTKPPWPPTPSLIQKLERLRFQIKINSSRVKAVFDRVQDTVRSHPNLPYTNRIRDVQLYATALMYKMLKNEERSIYLYYMGQPTCRAKSS